MKQLAILGCTAGGAWIGWCSGMLWASRDWNIGSALAYPMIGTLIGGAIGVTAGTFAFA